MPKSETNLPIMTRSKKEGTFGDPKLSLNEVKNEATAKTILEKEKIDTPVVKQQVQSAKEIIKTDTIVEKKTLEQSVEKKFVIDKSTDKDRSSSKNDESLTLEKNVSSIYSFFSLLFPSSIFFSFFFISKSNNIDNEHICNIFIV